MKLIYKAAGAAIALFVMSIADIPYLSVELVPEAHALRGRGQPSPSVRRPARQSLHRPKPRRQRRSNRRQRRSSRQQRRSNRQPQPKSSWPLKKRRLQPHRRRRPKPSKRPPPEAHCH